MTSRNQIITVLSELKQTLVSEGFEIVGIFGSFARGEADEFSDVDIAYRLDRKRFTNYYPDGFSKLLRIEAIQKSLETLLRKRIDLVSLQSSNQEMTQSMLKEMIYV